VGRNRNSPISPQTGGGGGNIPASSITCRTSRHCMNLKRAGQRTLKPSPRTPEESSGQWAVKNKVFGKRFLNPEDGVQVIPPRQRRREPSHTNSHRIGLGLWVRSKGSDDDCWLDPPIIRQFKISASALTMQYWLKDVGSVSFKRSRYS